MKVRKNALCDYSASHYNTLMHNYFVNHCYIGSNPKYTCNDITIICCKAKKIIQPFEKYLDFTSMDINIKGCSEYNEFHKSMSKLIVYQQAVYLCQDYLYDHPNDFNVEEIQDQMNIFYKEMTDLTNYIITNCE
jgi:hypothetical protein